VPSRFPAESANVMTCWSADPAPSPVRTRIGVPVPAVIATLESATGGYCSDDVTAPTANDRVSPATVVRDVPNAACSTRNGVPSDVQTSTPTIVAAGMFVMLTIPELDATDGVAVVAAPNVIVGAPVPAVYPPDVASSVPFAVAVPFAVISRKRSGPVTVTVDTAWKWSSAFFVVAWSIAIRRPSPGRR
jgi:hypothetical protein